MPKNPQKVHRFGISRIITSFNTKHVSINVTVPFIPAKKRILQLNYNISTRDKFKDFEYISIIVTVYKFILVGDI